MFCSRFPSRFSRLGFGALRQVANVVVCGRR
jgi:hypothetical protein